MQLRVQVVPPSPTLVQKDRYIPLNTHTQAQNRNPRHQESKEASKGQDREEERKKERARGWDCKLIIIMARVNPSSQQNKTGEERGEEKESKRLNNDKDSTTCSRVDTETGSVVAAETE